MDLLKTLKGEVDTLEASTKVPVSEVIEEKRITLWTKIVDRIYENSYISSVINYINEHPNTASILTGALIAFLVVPMYLNYNKSDANLNVNLSERLQNVDSNTTNLGERLEDLSNVHKQSDAILRYCFDKVDTLQNISNNNSTALEQLSFGEADSVFQMLMSLS